MSMADGCAGRRENNAEMEEVASLDILLETVRNQLGRRGRWQVHFEWKETVGSHRSRLMHTYSLYRLILAVSLLQSVPLSSAVPYACDTTLQGGPKTQCRRSEGELDQRMLCSLFYISALSIRSVLSPYFSDLCGQLHQA